MGQSVKGEISINPMYKQPYVIDYIIIICTTASIVAAEQAYKYLTLHPTCWIHTLALGGYN